MIKYTLVCKNDHSFEGWFSSSSDYDEQRKKRLVDCPYCGSADVDKGIMAPAVSTSRKKDAVAKKHAAQMAMMNAAADKIRQDIAEKVDYVGENFADEARAIHYGEKPDRAIYGAASMKQASDLIDEGVPVTPLPDILVPKSTKKLN